MTFGVSGKLIMNTLVMYDHQTESLWAQSLYKGVEGPLAGVDLELIPATQTRWDRWLEAHPDTLVLDKQNSYQYERDPYQRYYSTAAEGIYGQTNID